MRNKICKVKKGIIILTSSNGNNIPTLLTYKYKAKIYILSLNKVAK